MNFRLSEKELDAIQFPRAWDLFVLRYGVGVETRQVLALSLMLDVDIKGALIEETEDDQRVL